MLSSKVPVGVVRCVAKEGQHSEDRIGQKVNLATTVHPIERIFAKNVKTFRVSIVVPGAERDGKRVCRAVRCPGPHLHVVHESRGLT